MELTADCHRTVWVYELGLVLDHSELDSGTNNSRKKRSAIVSGFP
uniref:Uncharacterized protein n=1 Tax=Anguilla anguilla TaxID=7936 RepID=A0A0E9V1V8_ANGAN